VSLGHSAARRANANWWHSSGRTSPQRRFLLPAVTFDRRLTIGGSARRVELLHLTAGHIAGDTVIWLPAERVLFTGDLVANGSYNIVRDADMRNWPDFLASLQALEPQVTCLGHGDRATGDLLRLQRSFLEALWRHVESRTRAGKSMADIRTEIEDIRYRLMAHVAVAFHVIPPAAELPVLSLAAQIERVFTQLGGPFP
jgi:glyoxylase-like metal-dependent hydrolase (beta-lactamase superfamily II)